MNAEAVLAVAAAVTTMTQLAKWGGLPTKFAPIVVLVFAAIGTAIWAISQADFTRATAFQYFSGWLGVAVAAAGIYGFTRSDADNHPELRTVHNLIVEK